ncbi:MAG: polyprenyl synthetase family protein [Candidatus Gastranaerophilales bacterium]|nr:polyprenyl synthetase family protein [Candidatus Gastranaerophilales bacterium]
MINPVSTNISQNKSDLSQIFEPISLELSVLDKKLIENLSSSNAVLNNITRYIIESGGKRLRPAVTFLIAKALNKGFLPQDHFQVGIALEMIHTATLIHDDVIDEAETRRGNRTLHKIWNDKVAIAAGDYLLAKALARLASINNNLVIDLFARIMGEICEGEIEQDAQYYNFINLDQYIEKSARKTAKLFVAGAESSAILTSGADNLTIKAAREYAFNFGIAFQIVDDILNFTSNAEEFGKPVGIDLLNGILTAPVIFALEEYEEKQDFVLKNLIQNKFKTESDFNLALDLVLNSGGIEKSKQLAINYAEIAKNSLSYFDDNPYKSSLLNLVSFILERKF